uniref:Uncharacterized protein n=1 Tax=Euplotes harpa TaxID=151035 RepID=A0A7S3JDU7_9SPIT|mmetsp:Transcript_32318/g.36837  ORF Transcript_32318/g.36837 Transcript_32318/m.36837 type:complete len:293 (+) Transcript_32318:1045-1923(+)
MSKSLRRSQERLMPNSSGTAKDSILKQILRNRASSQLVSHQVSSKQILSTSRKDDENIKVIPDETITLNEELFDEEDRSIVSNIEHNFGQSKNSLFHTQSNHIQSHYPSLRRNKYSFISSNMNLDTLKSKLMDSDLNRTFDIASVRPDRLGRKTSLNLPPISIGNMQHSADVRSGANSNMNSTSKIRFASPMAGHIPATNRAKISIKSELSETFRRTVASKDRITFPVSQPDVLADLSSQDVKIAKRPKKLFRLTLGTGFVNELHSTKQQVDFLKSITTLKSKLKSNMYKGC